MKRSAAMLAIIALGWFAPASRAQPGPAPTGTPRSEPTENVIVTAPKVTPDTGAGAFVRSYNAPSAMTGKIVRWREGICPVTAGQPAPVNRYVTQRVRAVAAMVGAPVNADGACKPNIDIVFTSRPQVLLDGIRQKHPRLLGHSNRGSLARVALVSHPVQAWYATQTADMNGFRSSDDERLNAGIVVGGVFFPNARAERVEGTRLRDGLSTEFYHVVIVIDLNRLNGLEIGPVADHVAMLALARTQAFEACQGLPSITNLLSAGCDAGLKADAMTGSDVAYLRALYKVNADLLPGQQQLEMANRMKDGLNGR